MEKYLNQFMSEELRALKNLNTVVEREMTMYYDTLVITNIISIIIFIAMIYYIYKANKRAEELEKENNIIKSRILQLEAIIEETSGKKIMKNRFFDSEF